MLLAGIQLEWLSWNFEPVIPQEDFSYCWFPSNVNYFVCHKFFAFCFFILCRKILKIDTTKKLSTHWLSLHLIRGNLEKISEKCITTSLSSFIIFTTRHRQGAACSTFKSPPAILSWASHTPVHYRFVFPNLFGESGIWHSFLSVLFTVVCNF